MVKANGPERADFLLRKVLKRARQLRIGLPGLIQTRYINTISPEQEPAFPGDEEMELRVRRIIRWNAALMVLRANHLCPGIGGNRTRVGASYRVAFSTLQRKDDEGDRATRCIPGHAAPVSMPPVSRAAHEPQRSLRARW